VSPGNSRWKIFTTHDWFGEEGIATIRSPALASDRNGVIKPGRRAHEARAVRTSHHRAGMEVIMEDDDLEDRDLLPGFRYPLRRLFADPARPRG
jgi:hypothetical protein